MYQEHPCRTIKVSAYEPLLQRHRALMSTEWAKGLYRQRKQLNEPVFGTLKEHYNARRFLLQGRSKVIAEWTLRATAFNLTSLHKECGARTCLAHRGN